MEAGDIEIACLCLCSTNVDAFLAGVPLDLLNKDADVVLGILRQYRQVSNEAMFKHWHQLVSDLSQSSLDVLSWRDEATRDATAGRVSDRALNHVYIWKYLSRMHTAFFLHEYKLAETCAKVVSFYANDDMNFNSMTMFAFLRGLIGAARYRDTKKWWHRAMLSRSISKFEGWARINGGVNVIHRLMLLRAESTSLLRSKKARSQMKACFDTAVLTATRAGFVADAALANELAGEHFHRNRDDFWANHYLSQAFELYSAWKCSLKTTHMLQRHNTIDSGHSGRLPVKSTFAVRYDLVVTAREMEKSIAGGSANLSHRDTDVGGSSRSAAGGRGSSGSHRGSEVSSQTHDLKTGSASVDDSLHASIFEKGSGTSQQHR